MNNLSNWKTSKRFNIYSVKDETFGRRSWVRVVFTLLLASFLAGCGTVVGTTIVAANNAERSRDRARTNDLVGAHLEWVKELQTKGDPMGDYLWANAHENNWVKDPIKDPQSIMKMYSNAAAKGSVDAQIWLGIKRFYAGASTPRDDIGKDAEWLPNVPIWQDGLKRVEQATQKQCFYLKPYIFAPQTKRCLAPRVAADDIWPKFRDGSAYPKDKAIRDYWYDKAIACETSPEFQNALRACPVFGRTSYRAKD